METSPIAVTVDGQEFRITIRPDDPDVYDFDWLNHPAGYGFTSAGAPMSRSDMEGAIKSFLAGINPATGFLD